MCVPALGVRHSYQEGVWYTADWPASWLRLDAVPGKRDPLHSAQPQQASPGGWRTERQRCGRVQVTGVRKAHPRAGKAVKLSNRFNPFMAARGVARAGPKGCSSQVWAFLEDHLSAKVEKPRIYAFHQDHTRAKEVCLSPLIPLVAVHVVWTMQALKLHFMNTGTLQIAVQTKFWCTR